MSEIRFGEFRLYPDQRRLFRGQEEILLTPKALEVLTYLAARSGEVVTKEELFQTVWPETHVGDHALTVQIRLIRRALGEGETGGHIETRHRRGYRFVLEPQPHEPTEPSPAAPANPITESAEPVTRYARSGDFDIAYQVIGNGPIDVVFVMGWVSHLEYFWKEPSFARFLRKIASFSRLILFDKRGTGLSDRVPLNQLPTLEQRMDDVRTVMEAVGSKQAVLVGVSEGGPMSALFAATYPEKTLGLVMIGTYAKRIKDDSYPWGRTPEGLEQFVEVIRKEWGGPVGLRERAPSRFQDAAFRDWWATYLRMGASPSAAVALTRMNAEIDVRHVLEAVRVPALVIHRTGDRCLLVDEGRYVASHILGARFVELPGADHLPFVGDQDEILDEIEDFVATARHLHQPERVLATVLVAGFEDAEMRAARERRRVFDLLQERVRQEVEWFRGRPLVFEQLGPLATFDGPARALRCAHSIGRQASLLGLSWRSALHTGECDLLDHGRVSGLAVDVARTIHTKAAAGEILASSTVRDLVAGSGIHFEERGAVAFENLERQWRLYRVARE
ncbi:MAG: alpha/beta fold hydrolase [Bryobacteraceae bacterium]